MNSQHLDSEVIEMLQSSDLLIAELTSLDTSVLGLAHALFVPTIRFTISSGRNHKLPSMLTGHPFGYERDIFVVENVDSVSDAIRSRITSMDEHRQLIFSEQEGLAYFRSKLNLPHKVFVSHNLKGTPAQTIKLLIERLRLKAVNAWESRETIEAGSDWRSKLGKAMADTTHVIFIADGSFEQSEACWDELQFFSQEIKIAEGKVFPFLWGGRTTPLRVYNQLDNVPIPEDPATAAAMMAERIVAVINSSARRD